MEHLFLFFLYLCSMFSSHFAAYGSVMNRQNDRRNLFAERGCCKRQSNFVYIGQDISGSPVSVDVGLCRSHCGVPQRINAYNQALPGLAKHSSMLDILKNKKLRERVPDPHPSSGSEPSCPQEYTCQSTKVGIERVLLFQGIQEVEVIEDCQCSLIPEDCIRMPFLKTFFPDSPFESTVDVGKCSSPTKTTGLLCSPTKFDTVVVESPNGAEIVQTVENCEMKENCYRISYLEYYYEVVYHSNGSKEERVKEIDVGRCLGGCSSGSHCLLRDSRNRDHCIVWAEGSGNGCVPQDYETHTFRSRNGHIRSVFAIKTCKCQM
ncbi:pinhead L homeolog precursor [Xenopus laevis]|uniref:LOC100158295 protein n=1 Tax=Xenopus laevis TaxID=8355 RepID=B1H1S8_XENLA|nr:pinhead L homeolog precursor [Xenopus laevis]AAI60724.1 LOC100158295 protein [Xenopus laevis]